MSADRSPAPCDRSSPRHARSAHHSRHSSHGQHAVMAGALCCRVSTWCNDATEQAMADEVPAPVPIADPAPLGLAAFALTTFLLSAANAGWMGAATGDAWLGYALAYGGSIQLLAGMWEFRNRNVFGATAFSTYGGFWIGLFLWVQFVACGATN